jgi:aconitate hydratase
MGVLTLQFRPGESVAALGLSGRERFDVLGIEEINTGPVPREVTVAVRPDDGPGREFRAVVRIDTPGEAEYFRHGGIMQYVLRTLLARH